MAVMLDSVGGGGGSIAVISPLLILTGLACCIAALSWGAGARYRTHRQLCQLVLLQGIAIGVTGTGLVISSDCDLQLLGFGAVALAGFLLAKGLALVRSQERFSWREAGFRQDFFLPSFILGIACVMLLLAAPGLLFPTRRAELTALSALGVFGIWLLLSVWGSRLVWMPGRQDLALALVLGAVAIAALRGEGSLLTLSKVSGVLFGVAVYFVSSKASSIAQARTLLVVFLVCGTAIALTGMCLVTEPQKYAPLSALYDSVPWVNSALPELWGGRPNANQLAGTLLFVWPIALALALAPGKSGMGVVVRIVALCSAVVVGVVLIICQSRSGWAGALVGLLLVLAVRGRKARRIILGTLAALLILCFAFVPISVMDFVAGELLAGDTIHTPWGEFGLHGRPAVWSQAIDAIRQSPWLGNGLGTYRLYGGEDVVEPYSVGMPHAHNVLLQLVYDVGLVGTACVLGFCAVVLLQAILLLQRGNGWMAAIGLGALAALAAFGIYGIADTVALGAKTGVFFWILAALVDVFYQMDVSRTWTGE